ncbi:tRNA-binding protein [Euryarchaeota archaeon ex4484_178]|nr:MAG: tRNA-binding protein [Euryarchaeota archaeon ex4484_178]
MDTANDVRILMAERCVRDMEKYIGNLRDIKKSGILKDIEAKIMELKYSYGELDDLRPLLSEIRGFCIKILHHLGGDEWSKRLRSMKFSSLAIFHIKFCLNILYNLENRLKLPPYPEYAVDIRIGEVESVIKHSQANRLRICNVNVGKMITVVTNIENVKEGERLAVILLPPVEFFGVVSEGMFLSHQLKDGSPGDIPPLNEEERKNARKEVMKYLR